MRESIPEMETVEQKEILNPTAIISRMLKIQRGMNVSNEEQRTFPIFKEKPSDDSLINTLKKLNTETYGLIQGSNIIVFERGNPSSVATTNYIEIASNPVKTINPKTIN